MNTQKYLDWVLKRTGYQNTPPQMLDLMNIAQNEIFSYNTNFTKLKPESATLLETQDGILQYTLDDPTIRQVARVWSYTGFGFDSGYCATSRYYGFNGNYGNYGNYTNDDKFDIPVQVDESLSTEDNVTIYFQNNPGDTTDQYYIDAYLWPFMGQLTSTSVQMSLPEKVQTGLLFYVIVRMLEEDKDGRSIYNVEREERMLKDYFTFANQGAEISTNYPNAYGV